MMPRILFVLLFGLWGSSLHAFELAVETVSDGVYAIVGEIGPRKAENHGLNNTLAFVVTDQGVVLIGSGANPAGARLVEQAVAETTDRPIKLVVNIGVQDHQWLGNSYFADKGVPIKALARTADDQRKQVGAQLQRLEAALGEETKRIVPTYAADVVNADRETFNFGGVAFELLWPGGGHFAGDAVLWLPQSRTLISGDYIFLDRILGVHPTSKVAQWRRSFHVIEKLDPLHVIPGHGHGADLSKAQSETGNYLDWLTSEVGKAVDEWQEIEETIEALGDAQEYKHLKYYDSWHRRNIHQTFMQLEAGR
jgi:glyoxylase-like metal-dependent hydrolase (beta-lactamase superfamily II)